MKSSRLFLFALLIAFVTCVSSSTMAKEAKTPPPPPDVRKLISEVDVKANSVTIVNNRDKSKHTYKLDGMTQLKINNQDGKFADIKVGMVVDDSLERDNDDLDALSLSGYGTTKSTATKPTSTKPKPAATPAAPPTQ